jgi:hypothetical protein
MAKMRDLVEKRSRQDADADGISGGYTEFQIEMLVPIGFG